MIPWWNTELGESEIARATDALSKRCVSQGRLTAKFEEALAERLKVPHVICTSSGTTALTMAFLATGVGPGAEVIVPNRTWIATANAALLLGAVIRVVDSRPGSMLIDESLIEAAITPATKAIAPVSLNGASVDNAHINEIAERHGLTVVEDACQALFSAHGGTYQGTRSRFGCFSLGMTKLITTGAGGFIVCHDSGDADLLRSLRYQGNPGAGMETPWEHFSGGFKYTDIQAAIGLAQLERVEERQQHMRAIHQLYEEGLQDTPFLKLFPINADAGEVPNKALTFCSEPSAFRTEMEAAGVQTLEQAPNVADYPFIDANPDDYPRSRPYAVHNVVLPCGPDQPLENIEKAIEAVRSIAGKFKPLEQSFKI